MSSHEAHDAHEGKKIGQELRHHQFGAANRELTNELHSHPKEFEHLLKNINADLAKHHQNPLSVERNGKNEVSHINFDNHDIYSSSQNGSPEQHNEHARRASASRGHGGHGAEGHRRGGHKRRSGGQPDSGSPDDDDAGKATDDSAAPKATDKSIDPKSTDPKSTDKQGDPKSGDQTDPAKTGTNADKAPVSADGLRGANNTEKAMNFFLDKGLTKIQAAGIVGNLDHEAPGVNPNQHQQNGGPGFGIAQWEKPRQKGLREQANEEHKPVNDLKVQLDYVWKEMNTTLKGALSGVERSRTLSQAARAFELGFEGASRPNMPDRVALARNAFRSQPGEVDSGPLIGSR